MEVSIKQQFKKKSGRQIGFVFASSGMLARQIQNGAPYDVFLSASEGFVSELADSGQIRKDSVRPYALGRIALWSHSGSIKTVEDLAGPGVRYIAIANPTHAPYGLAARQMLERSGLWQVLAPRLVYGENIRQTLQFAESGNADATITAWSLVFDRGGILLPPDRHDPIRQTGGIVVSSRRADLARQFLEFLTSPEGIALLERNGFSAIPAR